MVDLGEKSHDPNLDFSLNRRAFFPALLREVRVLSSTLKGSSSFALSELGHLPDDQLARLIPMIQPAFSVYVEGAQVVGRHRETGTEVELFPAERENVLALNLFTGRITLATAGRRLAQQMDWDEAQGFALVKDLFLLLVSQLVCVPCNSPGPEE
jgi:hypothetical protein